MFFVFHVTTPANTPISEKKKTDLQVAMGVVTGVQILFPPGCAGLVGLQITDALHQLWPTNPGEYFQSARETIVIRERLSLEQDPLTFFAYTWNDDDTYSHTLTIRIEILPHDAAGFPLLKKRPRGG